jgi:hypothetical protein
MPTMKAVAASIPSLEAAASFIPDEAERYDRVPKVSNCALTAAACMDVRKPPSKPVAADAWPALPEGRGDVAEGPKRIRVDVGWALWDADAGGDDMQYQVR